jgi:hypothetical protein
MIHSSGATMLTRQLILAAALPCAVWLAGCGGGATSGPDVIPVTGKVLKGGQPLGSASVAFMPQSGGAPSYAFTDPNGAFVLTYNDGREGAVPGPHTVVITTGAPDPVAAEKAANGQGPAPKPLAEPKEYRQSATVAEGTTELTINIDA